MDTNATTRDRNTAMSILLELALVGMQALLSSEEMSPTEEETGPDPESSPDQEEIYVRSPTITTTLDYSSLYPRFMSDYINGVHTTPVGMQTDPEQRPAAVRQNGSAIQYLTPEEMTDPEVMLAAVRQTGTAIEHLPPRMRLLSEMIAGRRHDVRSHAGEMPIDACVLAVCA